MQKYFDILNRLGVTYECDRHTDGRTDGQTETGRWIDCSVITNAALSYVARSMKENVNTLRNSAQQVLCHMTTLESGQLLDIDKIFMRDKPH